MDYDLTLSQDKVQHIAGVAVAHVNGFVAEMRRLFLVEDLVDSIKFGVILCVMTYIGAWFNGMTLVIMGEFYIYLFSFVSAFVFTSNSFLYSLCLLSMRFFLFFLT